MKLFSTWPIRLAALAGMLVTAGCVQHVWAPGPDAHGTFDEQSARCRLVARAGERGYIAFGSSSYVAGAAIGNAIGNAVRAQADFNDCMAASGWLAVDTAPAPAEAAASGAPPKDPPPSGPDNSQIPVVPHKQPKQGGPPQRKERERVPRRCIPRQASLRCHNTEHPGEGRPDLMTVIETSCEDSQAVAALPSVVAEPRAEFILRVKLA
jgi:hypothetical protein